ncbi:hypothetical protein [Rhodococcus yananensis]|uniref:hypothetical protein n=1 Tax=Rhodococcus yananensis TaxID=2879464 RepID=UPI001CF86644|nr:hypothetical protein [Rhodococcus yananensis]
MAPGLRRVLDDVVDEARRLVVDEYRSVRENLGMMPQGKRTAALQSIYAIPYGDREAARRAVARMSAEGFVRRHGGRLLSDIEITGELQASGPCDSQWSERGFTLTLVDDRTLEWVVDKDSWARRRADGTALAAAAIEFLGAVQWTPGTGGVITGNDECNSDNNGPCPDYVTRRFGPVGENA